MEVMMTALVSIVWVLVILATALKLDTLGEPKLEGCTPAHRYLFTKAVNKWHRKRVLARVLALVAAALALLGLGVVPLV
jgi:hypothetical protein